MDATNKHFAQEKQALYEAFLVNERLREEFLAIPMKSPFTDEIYKRMIEKRNAFRNRPALHGVTKEDYAEYDRTGDNRSIKRLSAAKFKLVKAFYSAIEPTRYVIEAEVSYDYITQYKIEDSDYDSDTYDECSEIQKKFDRDSDELLLFYPKKYDDMSAIKILFRDLIKIVPESMLKVIYSERKYTHYDHSTIEYDHTVKLTFPMSLIHYM